jgi:hypothetical protein
MCTFLKPACLTKCIPNVLTFILKMEIRRTVRMLALTYKITEHHKPEAYVLNFIKFHYKIATCDKSYNPAGTLVFKCKFCDSALSPFSVVVRSIQNLTKCTTKPHCSSQLSACKNYRTVWVKVLRTAMLNMQVFCNGWVLPVILNNHTTYICMVQQCSALLS